MIRPIISTDRAAVAALAVSSGLFPIEEVAIVEKLIADYFARDDGHRCLIDIGDEPVGVAYYQPAVATDRTWYLTMIGVRRDDQGGGRGSTLLASVEDELRADGQRLLLVETSGLPEFSRARAFYVRNGYDEEARVRDYFGDGDDMVLFRKQLDPSPRGA